MKNILKINHENRTLVMDRTFAKAASFVGSNEYNLLQDARRDYPSYQVTLRSIKKKEDKESYSQAAGFPLYMFGGEKKHVIMQFDNLLLDAVIDRFGTKNVS